MFSENGRKGIKDAQTAGLVFSSSCFLVRVLDGENFLEVLKHIGWLNLDVF